MGLKLIVVTETFGSSHVTDVWYVEFHQHLSEGSKVIIKVDLDV
jgi:hypothetical protein